MISNRALILVLVLLCFAFGLHDIITGRSFFYEGKAIGIGILSLLAGIGILLFIAKEQNKERIFSFLVALGSFFFGLISLINGTAFKFGIGRNSPSILLLLFGGLALFLQFRAWKKNDKEQDKEQEQ